MIERAGITRRKPELSLLFRSGRPPAFTLRQSPPQKKDKSIGMQFLFSLQVEVPTTFLSASKLPSPHEAAGQDLVAYTATFSSSTHRRIRRLCSSSC